MTAESTAADRRARSPEQGALEEALDHLLDPLKDDSPNHNGTPGEETVRRPPEPIPIEELHVPYHAGPTVRDLAVRLRWSERGIFRIPRRVVAWGAGLAGFWALVWIILSFGGLH